MDVMEGVDQIVVSQLIRDGMSDGHIAAELGVPRSAVEEIRARLESEARAEAEVAG